MLQRIMDYFSLLIDRGFCGTVRTSFDKGMLQREIRREETDRMDE
jgi:hypothetical protein